MPRVSKRTKKAETQPQIKYYRTYIYLRLSEKDGGHGRRDSIYIQKQICVDFAKKHPEMLIMKVYTDNGVTGTTFERKAFEELMTDVRAGKVDCIIVKDFSRFGRDALDAVDDAMGCQFSVPLFLLEEFRDENILEKIKNFGGIYTWLESCELEHEIQKFITVHLDPRGIILYMDILSHRQDKNDIMPEPAVKLSMEKWITKKNGTEYACS